MDNIIWLTMRRMRTPLIVMILVYALSVFGMVLIPGQDEAGRAVQVNFLDATYFIAIMATTIGFGEMPVAFTDAQRLYVFIILFPERHCMVVFHRHDSQPVSGSAVQRRAETQPVQAQDTLAGWFLLHRLRLWQYGQHDREGAAQAGESTQ